MSPPLVIRRIVSIKGIGIFRDFVAGADQAVFQHQNLIYGFNGSGKTTLSRIFASLGLGSAVPELPAGGQYEVEMSDGTHIKSEDSANPLKGRLLVFNTDFIEENLRWKEGTANPVFYLGKTQVDLAKELDETEARITTLNAKRTLASRDHIQKEKAFTDRKRDAARLIAEQLGLGRKYDATNLVADYSRNSYPGSLKLSEQARQELRATIAQEAPLPRCNPIEPTMLDLNSLLTRAKTVLGTTIGDIAIEGLQRHEDMLQWIREGARYHQHHNLETCLLCGNPISPGRWQAIKLVINDKLEQLLRDVAATKEDIERFRLLVSSTKSTIPSINDVSKAVQTAFSAAANDFRKTLDRGDDIATAFLALLNKKSASLNSASLIGDLPPETGIREWDNEAGLHLSYLNASIEEHNRLHDQFNTMKEKAREKLKASFLADDEVTYREMLVDVNAAKASSNEIEQQYRETNARVEVLRQEIRQHGPAAELINKMVEAYLGHSELKIGTIESGYEILRHDKPLKGSPSEGEKTALALSYFLSTLGAEGRQRKSLILVVDDPISSLDTRALHYAFSIIRSTLADVAQLIVLTHNIHFMNEVKKWLKNKARDGKAALLFLSAPYDPKTKTRFSSIQEMPRLIRDYDSEYQYLFHLVLEFIRAGEGDATNWYLMPNALRKVLEIFLAFKVPGSDGLSNKIENILSKGYQIDPAKIRALDRLVQLESHADSLDDLVAFSSMTIEETKDAAQALLVVMESIDRAHCDQLRHICR